MNLKLSNMFSPKTGVGESGSSHKEMAHLVSVLAIPIFIIAFSVVAIRHFWQLFDYNSKVIDISETAQQTAETNLKSVESLKSSLSSLERGDYGSKEVLDALPSKYDYSALLTSIEKITIQNGLTIESLTAGEDQTGLILEEAPEPKPEEMQFLLTAQGSYEEIQNLVEDLEISIRPMQIRRMELAGDGSSMQVDIEGVTYYQLSESLEITTKTISPDN